jgi:hypothetical protein
MFTTRFARDTEIAEKYPAQNQHWKPKHQNQGRHSTALMALSKTLS